jgi:hypothetical protein
MEQASTRLLLRRLFVCRLFFVVYEKKGCNLIEHAGSAEDDAFALRLY